MTFSATSVPTLLKQPKTWQVSIGNGDTTNWKRLVTGGANGSKVTCLSLTSTDSSSRNIYIAHARSSSVTVTSASPGVVSWTGHGLVAGDQVFFGGTTVPTGVTASLPYYVISAGLTADVFEFSATAGGAAINTSSTGSAVIAYAVKVIGTVVVAITAGTDGATAAVSAFTSTLFPALPVDNDGQPYLLLEFGDYLSIASSATITANKIINAVAQSGDF